MSSLADLLELVGFFSYSREDDEDSHGALSALRTSIQGELRGQLGRTARSFRLWQDKEAIPSGTLWEGAIKNSIGQAVFFIPIITPTVVASPHCRFELEAFLAREAELGRDDLVFPILYIDVPALEDSVRRQNDPVLSLIAKRQYVDWRKLRHRDVRTTDASEAVERFCRHIRDALRRPWFSPEERKQQEEAAALTRAEAERQRRDAEVKRRGEEEARQRAAEQERQKREAEAQQRRKDAADDKRRDEEDAQRRREGQADQQAEAERRRSEAQRLREEAEAKRRVEAEERRRSALPPPRPKPRPALLIGSLVGVVALGAIAAWVTLSPTPAPVTPAPPASVTPAPAPAAQTQQAANGPLSAAQERALKPADTFQECSKCPVMVVVPASSFTMGSPSSEIDHRPDEGPQHTVMIAQQFSVGKFEVTFDEWDACTADGGCNGYRPSDGIWGRGRRPVINVSWDNAKAYVAWLSEKTGKTYRLLTEAEYEYATRAGTTTAYPWGNAIGKNNANCDGCGGQWDNKETAPVGSFEPNQFGLYDMVGNVWAFVEDCYHENYDGAPTDGSAWIGGDCSHGNVARGGSWGNAGDLLRSAMRGWPAIGYGGSLPIVGFRVARTLLAP